MFDFPTLWRKENRKKNDMMEKLREKKLKN